MVPHRDLQWDWPSRPTDDRAFAAMMLSLDGYLAVSGYEPHYREGTARDLIQFVFGFQAATYGHIVRMLGPPKPWDGRDLLERIGNWYQSAYGTRRYSAGFMSAACALRGTMWTLNVPEVFGTVNLVADTNLALGNHEPVWNVLNSVDGAGPEIMLGLTSHEHWYLLELAQLASTALMTFSTVHASPLKEEAIADYVLSIQALVTGTSYNSARWLNAQCAEKLIKTALSGLNVKYGRKSHSIPEYCRLLAENDPAFDLPTKYQEQIDCRPGVRYGEDGNTHPMDALVSHHALLRLLEAMGSQRGVPPNSREGRWHEVD